MNIPGWVIVLFIITEILVWDILKGCLSTIRHCATAKAYRYRQFAQNNKDTVVHYDEFSTIIQNESQNKEVVTNGKEQLNNVGQ